MALVRHDLSRAAASFRKDLDPAVRSIVAYRHSTPASRATLAAITGIDGSGKGYVTAALARTLEDAGLRVAAINIDGFLNLPHVRFNRDNPAEHFYEHAIRFDDLFEQLVHPLRATRSIRVECDFAEETAAAYRPHRYEFTDIDVILLDGIYLLKRPFHGRYDLAFWIDCPFDTALARAVARAQEGLSPQATVAAYRTIYFPAQEIHFALDNPIAAATAVISNDANR